MAISFTGTIVSGGSFPSLGKNEMENGVFSGYANLAALAAIPVWMLTANGAIAPTSDGNLYIWNGAAWAVFGTGPTGPAGGGLAGTYPNPTIAANAIANAQVTAAAAIAGTKIDPSFGAQNVSTTGTLASGAATTNNAAAGTVTSLTVQTNTLDRLRVGYDNTNGYPAVDCVEGASPLSTAARFRFKAGSVAIGFRNNGNTLNLPGIGHYFAGGNDVVVVNPNSFANLAQAPIAALDAGYESRLACAGGPVFVAFVAGYIATDATNISYGDIWLFPGARAGIVQRAPQSSNVSTKGLIVKGDDAYTGGVTGTNGEGGLLTLIGGTPSGGDRYQGVQIQSKGTLGIMAWAGQVQKDSVSPSNVLAVCSGGLPNASDFPTGAGDRVMLFGPAAVTPTVAPGSGFVTLFNPTGAGAAADVYRVTPAGVVQAIAPSLAAVVFALDANHTASAAEARATILKATSTVALTAQRDFVVPILASYAWTITNATTGGQSIQVIGVTGTGVVIGNGKTAVVYADGTNIVRVSPDT